MFSFPFTNTAKYKANTELISARQELCDAITPFTTFGLLGAGKIAYNYWFNSKAAYIDTVSTLANYNYIAATANIGGKLLNPVIGNTISFAQKAIQVSLVTTACNPLVTGMITQAIYDPKATLSFVIGSFNSCKHVVKAGYHFTYAGYELAKNTEDIQEESCNIVDKTSSIDSNTSETNNFLTIKIQKDSLLIGEAGQEYTDIQI